MATKNIVPNDNGEGGIGVTGKRWNTAFINTITGDLTGNVTGNVSGTAATVTGAAQSNITSLGILTTLTVDDITINGSTISDSGDLLFDIGGDISLDAAGGDFIFLVGGSQYGKINFLGTNNLTISGSAADHAGLSFATHAILPAEVSATTDGTIDLGASSEQFKTIFLSTGVVVANDGTIGSAGTNSAITIDSSGIVGIGSTGIYAGTNAILNLQGSGIALKNDRNGSNNNWSYIQNDGTGSEATIKLSTGNALPALTLSHNGDATFANDIILPQDGVVAFNSTSDEYITATASNLFFGVDNGYVLKINGTDDRVEVRDGHDLKLDNGNLVIGTAGKGIDFSVTANQGVSTPHEILDDYEEGTFTPTFTLGGSIGTVASSRYTIIGNMCHFNFFIYTLTIPNDSNEFRISLPVTPDSTVGDYTGLNLAYSGSFNSSALLPISHHTAAHLYFHKNTGNASTILNSDVQGLDELIVSGWYYI